MYTAKKAYEDLLREQRKNHAPSLPLEDYLYFFNKGISTFIKAEYDKFEETQKITDNIAQVSTMADFEIISPTQIKFTFPDLTTETVNYTIGKRYNSLFIRFKLPKNYRYFLGSHINVLSLKPYLCYGTGFVHTAPTAKLTSDIGNGTINNAFLKPAPHRPFHSFLDQSSNVNSGVPADIYLYYGNSTAFKVKSGSLDYIKQPATVFLTESQIDSPVDNSQVLEFPDQVVLKMIDRTNLIILENRGNPRIQSQPAVNPTD